MTGFVQRGELSSATDMEGNIYLADGVIWIYGQDGIEKGTIKLDERPISIVFGMRIKECCSLQPVHHFTALKLPLYELF